MNKTETNEFNRLKKGAPGVPPETCPYIDFVLERVKKSNYDGQTDRVSDAEYEVLRSTLEFIRESNATLRRNSYYWYTEYKKLLNKHSKYKNKVNEST
jgi:hypothetical protein